MSDRRIEDPHADDHPEAMLGYILIYAIVLVLILVGYSTYKFFCD